MLRNAAAHQLAGTGPGRKASERIATKNTFVPMIGVDTLTSPRVIARNINVCAVKKKNATTTGCHHNPAGIEPPSSQMGAMHNAIAQFARKEIRQSPIPNWFERLIARAPSA